MDNRHSIGSKIQKYRKLKDMTQDELSKQSGIYLSTRNMKAVNEIQNQISFKK